MPRDQARKNELRRSASSKLFLYKIYFSVGLMRGFRPTSNLLQLRIRRRFFNNVMRGARSNSAKSFYGRVKKKGEKAMTRCEYDIGEHPWKNIVGQGHQREAVSFSSKMELLLFCRAGFVVFSPNAPALFFHAIDLARKVDPGWREALFHRVSRRWTASGVQPCNGEVKEERRTWTTRAKRFCSIWTGRLLTPTS